MNAKRFYESGGDTLAVRADAPETVVGAPVDLRTETMVSTPGARVLDLETYRRGSSEGLVEDTEDGKILVHVRVRWDNGDSSLIPQRQLMLYDDVKRKVLWALGAALAGVAVGALLWPGHRVIGALIGAKVGLGGYAVATGRRKEGAVLLATAAGGFLLARTWQRHPVVGYLLGSAGGSAAGRAGIGIAEGMARG